MKKIAVLFLFLFFPLVACSNQARAPDVSQAQADLHKTEVIFNGALKTILALQRSGVLKGERNEQVKKGVVAAHAAIKSARAAVDAGQSNAVSLALTAATVVLEVVSLYTKEP